MRFERWGIGLILVLFLVLGVYYSVTVPIFEAPDEMQHFFFARYVADTWDLPVQTPNTPALWAQEGSQPPLYYLLAALVMAPVRVERAADYLWENPHRNVGVPFEPGNKNYLVHTERERWPYRDLPLAVHLARWLSLFLGAGTVLGTWFLAHELAPERPYLALAAAATVAFIPQVLFIHAAVSNDPAVAFTATWSLWWLVRLMKRGGSYRHVALLALWVGWTTLSKLSGLALVPLVLVGLALAWRWGRLQVRPARALVLFGLVVAGVAGWWYARNFWLYGDPTGLNRMLAIVGSRRLSLSLDFLLGEWRGLRWSFWGLFGWFNVPMGIRAYRVLDGVLALIAVGWGIALVRGRGRPWTPRHWAIALVSAWAVIVFLSLWRWVTLTYGAQGRLLFAALAAIGFLLVLGWVQWSPEPARPFWAAVLPLGLLGLALIAPSRWIAPAYAYPPRIAPEAIPPSAKRVDILFGNRIRLWAVETPNLTVYPGGWADVTLYLSKAGPLPVDYSLGLHLLGRELEDVGSVDTFPGWGTYPTRLWREGEVIVDRYRVRVDPNARTPTLLRVAVSFYNFWTQATLPATTLEGQPLQAYVASLRLVSPNPQVPAPQRPLRAVFGDEIALIGVDPPPAQARPGDVLTFRLDWQGLRPARASYTVFTHLIREGDPRPVAQHDKIPLDGDYPTLAWAPDEVVVDTYRIAVPTDAAPGTYYLIAGLYHLATLQRLPLAEGPRTPWVTDAAAVWQLAVVR